jgi:hypothetical protein
MNVNIAVDTNLKIINVIIIFNILLTDIGHNLLENNTKFKNIVKEKIIEFKLENNKNFTQFLKDNFEDGKRFISKKKNKEYRRRITRLYLLNVYRFNCLYKKIKKKNDEFEDIFHEDFYTKYRHCIVS